MQQGEKEEQSKKRFLKKTNSAVTDEIEKSKLSCSRKGHKIKELRARTVFACDRSMFHIENAIKGWGKGPIHRTSPYLFSQLSFGVCTP